MFRGRVSPLLEPLVPLEVLDTGRQIHTIEAILDTGFDGSLCLPGQVIRRIGYPLYDDFASTLANSQEVILSGYEGQIMWHGRRRTVLVLESEDQALLGMNLLWRNQILIGAYANGPVTIEELD